MNEMPSFLLDLCLVALTGGLAGLCTKGLGLPLIVGYVLAGYLIGPFAPQNWLAISDVDRVRNFSELGVILLMFSLGLEFGFKRLRAVGLTPVFVGLVETLGTWLIGTQVVRMLGFSGAAAQFFGAMLAIASTTVVVQTLRDRKLTSTRFADGVIGILLVEDLVAIIMLVYLPQLAQEWSISTIPKILGSLAVSVSLWWIIGSIIAPRLVGSAHRKGGDELLMLTSLALCLGLAILAHSFGFSTALGAFVMGAILANTRQTRRIEELIKPLRQTFGVLFFVSFGMLLEPAAVVGEWPMVVAMVAVIVIVKPLLTIVSSLLAGKPLPDAIRTAGALTQIGEFSFVIAGLALSLQSGEAFPKSLMPLTASVAVISILLSSQIFALANRLAGVANDKLPQRLSRLHQSYANTIRTISLYRGRLPGGGFGSIGKLSAVQLFFRWFIAKVGDNYRQLTRNTTSSTLGRLAPWDEYLSELVIQPGSLLEGKSLIELAARNKYNVNIVAVQREQVTHVSPDPQLRLFPYDTLLVYGREQDLVAFSSLTDPPANTQEGSTHSNHNQTENTLADCELYAIRIDEFHPFAGQELHTLQLRESMQCTVLAAFRDATKIKNPGPAFTIQSGDELYIVGPRDRIRQLQGKKSTEQNVKH